MAYVPPHKRHSNDKDKPSPSSELPPPQTHFRQNPRMKSSNTNIVYANKAISKWFAVGFHDIDHDDGDDDHLLPSCVKLHPVSLELVQRKFGEKPLILLYSDIHLPQHQAQGTQARNPWEVIADKALQNLLSSFEILRSEMEVQNLELEQVKPTLVARFGKILIHGGPSVTQEVIRKKLADGKRQFYTTIPTSYMDKITKEVALKVGLDFIKEKELYRVQLSDVKRPEATISCKCRMSKELNKLELYKIELNQVRQMVTDISCLTKNLDLRIMLCLYPKRVLKDDEKLCIQNLIDSAILDPNVKGGLRWPLGKSTSGDRFSVCGVWHTIDNVYTNRSVRLKARHADRFNFHTSMGESASEVYIKLKEIISLLQAQKVDARLISKVLEDNLQLIWDHFLNCDNFLG